MEEIRRSVERLKLIRNSDCGWGDAQGVKTKIVNTGEAIFGIIISGSKDSKFINESLGYLENSILNEKCYKITQIYWATLALLLANPLEFNNAILKSINCLLVDQNIDGGWRYFLKNKSIDPKVYPTTLAVRLLIYFRRDSEFDIEERKRDQINKSIQSGINWLISVQNDDGGWGQGKEEPSEAPATAHAIITLVDFTDQDNHLKINKGKDWLLRNQKENGEFPNSYEAKVIEEVREEGQSPRYQYIHFGTPWAIIALLKANMKVTDESLQKAIKYLIELQDKNGEWKISRESYPFIWATSNAILALSCTKEYFHPINDVAPLFNKIETLQRLNTKILRTEEEQRQGKQPSLDTGEAQFHEPYGKIILEVVKKIKDEPFLFVIAVIALLIGVVFMGTNLGSFDFRLIVMIIALLAFVALLGYYIVSVRKSAFQNLQK